MPFISAEDITLQKHQLSHKYVVPKSTGGRMNQIAHEYEVGFG